MSDIERRYKRRTIANPRGSVVHHGYCRVFDTDICTCGLLHDLAATNHPGAIFPDAIEQMARHNRALVAMSRRRDEQ